jgi:hypothetical protein
MRAIDLMMTSVNGPIASLLNMTSRILSILFLLALLPGCAASSHAQKAQTSSAPIAKKEGERQNSLCYRDYTEIPVRWIKAAYIKYDLNNNDCSSPE